MKLNCSVYHTNILKFSQVWYAHHYSYNDINPLPPHNLYIQTQGWRYTQHKISVGLIHTTMLAARVYLK